MRNNDISHMKLIGRELVGERQRLKNSRSSSSNLSTDARHQYLEFQSQNQLKNFSKEQENWENLPTWQDQIAVHHLSAPSRTQAGFSMPARQSDIRTHWGFGFCKDAEAAQGEWSSTSHQTLRFSYWHWQGWRGQYLLLEREKPTAGNADWRTGRQRRITCMWQIQFLHAFGLTNSSSDAVFFSCGLVNQTNVCPMTMTSRFVISKYSPSPVSPDCVPFNIHIFSVKDELMVKIDLEDPRTTAEKCLIPIPGLRSLRDNECLIEATWAKLG